MPSAASRACHALVHLGVLRLVSGDANATKNYDRLSCLRQDNLDLVIPSMDNLFRMVIPTATEDTASDIYVSIKNIEVKKLSAIATVTRGPKNTFKLDVFGDQNFTKGKEVYENVAVADLMLTGLGLFTEHSLIALGAQILPGHTSAQLFFKLSVEGRANYNETTGEWELELLNKEKPKPFEFILQSEGYFDSRGIIQQVLNDYTSIDDLIINNGIWPGIQAGLPKSFLSAFNFLDKDEFWPEVRVGLQGEMRSPESPLHVQMSVSTNVSMIPVAILKVFSQQFDPKVLAEQKLEGLFDIDDIKSLVENNRPGVVATLARYGIPAEVVDQGLDPDVLRSYLLNYTKAGADWLVRSLQPILDSYKHGTRNPFTGYELLVQGSLGWDALVDDGLMTAHVSGPAWSGDEERRTWLVMPVSPLAVPHAKGKETTLGHKFLKFVDGDILVENCHVKDFRMVAGGVNGTARQTYKFGGALRDIAVRLPKSWHPGWDAEWNESQITISKEGVVGVATSAKGVKLRQLAPKDTPGDPDAPERASLTGPRMRTGADWLLQGRVPDAFMRPSQRGADVSIFPQADIRASAELHSDDKQASISVAATATAKISMIENLRRVLAARPTLDFGYAFAAEYVERVPVRREASGAVVREGPEVAAAVVSCGYLRLLVPSGLHGSGSLPLKRITMDPGTRDRVGQLQLDLTVYRRAPDVYDDASASDRKCLKLHSGGYAPRSRYVGVFSSNDLVSDELCGPSPQILRLRNAIEIQVTRFRADEDLSKRWNYGTHPPDQPQHALAHGEETRNLMDILAEGHRRHEEGVAYGAEGGEEDDVFYDARGKAF